MSAMNRRAFIGRAAALTATALAPIPRAMAMVAPSAPPLRWYAVGTDEMSYTFLADSAEKARRYYAWEHGATVEDECPECGEGGCHEHNEDLDAPLDHVEVRHVFGEEFTPDKEPQILDWLRAGFNVPCEGDCASDRWIEPTECYAHGGKALCECCYEMARNAIYNKEGE